MIRDIYSYKALKELDEEFYASFISVEGEDIIQKSIILEKFLSKIFPIENELNEFYKQAELWNNLADFKLQFVQRRALRKYLSADNDYNSNKFSSISIHQFATLVLDMLKNEEQNKDELDEAMRYVAYKAYIDPDHSVFILPKKLDFQKLVDPDNKHHIPKNSMAEAHYCIYCHNQDKDHCRKGMDGKVNEIGNVLRGCPLGQKISEMNYLYAKGNIIAALAVTMIDNPLVAATGNRVCNDCMKSCIYQKQEPVDIPCIESDMLRDVLRLPYGAEIYYLLTRWNPLCGYVAKPHAPGKVLVAGLGPAGFAMSYYLLRSGHKVTAVDSMKILKLDEKFFVPIRDWKDTVGKYTPQGFGGVSEYGITDRWDKSNLLLIRMILERFSSFEIMGETKIGHDISLRTAADTYDYIALCLGAGTPNLPEVKNADAKGIFSAFDFLMEMNCSPLLSSVHNSIIPPVVVLGAGLTAIDCATEALSSLRGGKRSGNPWIASSPTAPRNDPEVTILYRKSIAESPSYRENHEELQIALDKGIKFTQNTNLESIELDESGRIKSVNGSIPARTLIFAFGTGYNDQILLDEPEVAKLHKEKIGIFGDLDPNYTGSVVKAIASSKDTYERVSALLMG